MSEQGFLKLRRKGKLWQVIRIVGKSRFAVTDPIEKGEAAKLLSEMRTDDAEVREAA